MTPRLISLPVSPYVELARWTLDRAGVAYEEEHHAPVFHVLATRRAGGTGVVPVLDLGDESLTDARQVVQRYDPLPDEEGRRVFDDVFDVLGVAVRAWAYAYMLPHRRATARAWVHGVPALQRRLVPVLYPLLAWLVRRDLGLKPGSVPEQRAIVDAALARLEERLADGRRRLLGDATTAADVALASLLAPAVLPPEYRGPLPALDEVPEAMRRDIEGFREHPVGRYALRLYAEERDAPPPMLRG
ncbi:MAG: glutathione S-transferase [Actinomycetota bacterium]|nr:glutathione S-transferase [Actinomycetota bacterium]